MSDLVTGRREIGDDEMDITPAMIEAGMHEYGIRWRGLRDADDEVAREMIIAVYREMMSLRRR